MSTPLCSPSIEPFPSFVDSDEDSPSYFTKKDILQLLNKSSVSQLQRHPRTSSITRLANDISANLANNLRLRYYQYEVTFGLYMMTPGEKLVLNFIVIGIFAAIVSALYIGLQPFLVRSICQLLYLTTGSLDGVEDICSGTGCS